MARPKKPSPAALWLVRELARRNATVTPRAVEGWAGKGLAPAPVRRSLGRGRGTVSEYPAGAVDQYAAVASVMRRGRPWQVSVLMLLARGRLPTNENLVQQALQWLLAPPQVPPGEDALEYAERLAEETADTPFARQFLRAYESNLRRSAQILEPGTQTGPVALGVLATLTLARIGQPIWTPEALTELLAAHGVPVAELPDDDRTRLAQFADDLFSMILTGPGLEQLATETPLLRIQAAIPQGRTAIHEALAGLAKNLPRPSDDIIDALTVLGALLQIRIQDLGGEEVIADLARQALQEDHAVGH